MKNFSKMLFVIVFILLVSIEIVYAKNSGNPFGGKITSTEASEIEDLEGSGFTCMMSGGQSIEIKSIKGPTSYYIPASTKSKTSYSLKNGQWILGKYGGQTTITCIYDADEEIVESVSLNTITLYGTSKN